MGQLLFKTALGRDAIVNFAHTIAFFFSSFLTFFSRSMMKDYERAATNTHVTLRVIFKEKDYEFQSFSRLFLFFLGRIWFMERFCDCKSAREFLNSPSVFDSFSMTPPICRSPLTRNVFSTCRSVIRTRIFQVLSPT